ncbi:MAG: LemA family protein, partial [Planctomycetota bacterium]
MEPHMPICLGSAAVPATVVVVIVAAFALWVALAFNRLVRERNLVAEGWSGIDVQLKRRHNLIPALVETVTGYAQHERTTLTEITELRTRSRDSQAIKDRQESENALTDQLKGLFALAESYPDLKASRNFLNLSDQLGEI